MNRRHSEKGISLIELLIATGLTAAMTMYAYQFLQQFLGVSLRFSQGENMEMDLRGLTNTVAQQFNARGPGPSVAVWPSTAYGNLDKPACPVPSTMANPPPCENLTIAQTNPKYGTMRWINYVTTCVASTTALGPNSGVLDQNLKCPANTVPQVTIVRTESSPVPAPLVTTKTFPAADGYAGAFCARLLDDCAGNQTVIVEAAGSFRVERTVTSGGSNYDVVRMRIMLSSGERSPNFSNLPSY